MQRNQSKVFSAPQTKQNDTWEGASSKEAETVGADGGGWRGMVIILLCALLSILGMHLATDVLRGAFPAVWRAVSDWAPSAPSTVPKPPDNR